MSKIEISLCMIVRDCDEVLEYALKSARPWVDEICIVDTGSTDKTPEIALKYADKYEVFLACNDEQNRIADFSLARNRSMDLATKDWIIWLDSDDILDGGEHLKEIAETITADNAIVMLPYEYSFDELGNCRCVHWRERMFKPRHRFFWRWPVHEVAHPMEPIEGTITTVRSELVRVRHANKDKQARGKEPGRNLRILQHYVEQVHESDPRILYYIGLEYGYAGNRGAALRFLRRYIELSQWDDEKCLACLEMARHYAEMGDLHNVIDWALRASIIRSWPDPYFRLGRAFYALAMNGERPDYNFHRAASFMQFGLQRGDTDTVLFVDPMDRYTIHEYLNVCLSRIGDIDNAIASCEAGLVGLPGHHALTNNLDIYRKRRARTHLLAKMDEAGLSPEQQEAIRGIIANDQVQPSQARPAAALPTLPPVARVPDAGKLDLVFVVGHQVEPWNPDTVAKTGIGGSETMAMHLAKRLAAKGHGVRMYGHCTSSMEGQFDGVTYLDASRYNGVECDVMISSRKPTAVDDTHALRAKSRVLWVHDISCGPELNQVRELRYDRILCLTEWHKKFFTSCYPQLNPAKVIVTRNGIDPARFKRPDGLKRNPHRVVYSSSPDRGLLALLNAWTVVRKEVPTAELAVFYGFGNWKFMAQQMGPDGKAHLRLIQHIEHLCRTLPGVTFRDRVSQDELAREFMASGVWAYPTWFQETSCITAMEAQAAGLAIVATDRAALKETVLPGLNRLWMLPWDRRDNETDPTPEYMEKFQHALIETMRNPLTDEQREDITQQALDRFGLDALAYEWDKMLLEMFHDVEDGVVPDFYPGTAA